MRLPSALAFCRRIFAFSNSICSRKCSIADLLSSSFLRRSHSNLSAAALFSATSFSTTALFSASKRSAVACFSASIFSAAALLSASKRSAAACFSASIFLAAALFSASIFSDDALHSRAAFLCQQIKFLFTPNSLGLSLSS